MRRRFRLWAAARSQNLSLRYAPRVAANAITLLNNAYAIITYAENEPYAAQFFEFAGNSLTRTLIVRNPDKLKLFADRENLVRLKVLQPLIGFLGLRAGVLIAAQSLKRALLS
jgi:glutathione synthase/RimK-type ligase-like ATP-grasp enzyme